MSDPRRIALVTGAARHTGYAIAAELLRQGMRVYVNDLDEDAVRSAVASLGEEARPAPADLSQPKAVDAMCQRVLDDAGRIDLLVNNACHHGIGLGFLDTPMALLDEVLDVNVQAVFQLSQRAAAAMIERGGGNIVHIGSNTSHRAIRNRSAYIASKGAIDSLTRAMALELAPHHVRVNAVAPGYVRTTRWEDLPADTVERRHNNIPLRFEADGKDVARAVAFLGSDAARRITGQRIVVDGGMDIQLAPPDADI